MKEDEEETHWTKNDLKEKSVPIDKICPECGKKTLHQFGPAIWCTASYCSYGLSKAGKILHKRKV